MKSFFFSTADQPARQSSDFYISTVRGNPLPMYVNDEGTIVDKSSAEYADWYAQTYGGGTSESFASDSEGDYM